MIDVVLYLRNFFLIISLKNRLFQLNCICKSIHIQITTPVPYGADFRKLEDAAFNLENKAIVRQVMDYNPIVFIKPDEGLFIMSQPMDYLICGVIVFNR